MVRSELEFEEYHDARSSKDKKERDRDDDRDRDRERNREREKVRDREKERNREKDKARERDREKDKARDREKDRSREKDRDRDRDRERERDRERDREEKDRVWSRDRERDRDDKERDWSRDRERDREDKEERERDRDRKEKDRERVRESSKDLEKEKEKTRDSDAKLKDKDEKKKDRGKDRGKEADIRRDADSSKERKKDKDKGDRDADKEKDREKEKEKDKDREKDRDREKERDKEKEKGKEKEFEKERERHKDRDGDSRHEKEKDQERQKEQEKSLDLDVERAPKDVEKRAGQENRKGAGSEIAAWVNKSRTLEEQKKIEERIKAIRMARLLSEQDSGEDSEDEGKPAYTGKDLSGLKILHGIDKVMEGGAVVLTLKDKAILDKDDVNDEVDELENLEISQQLNRDKAYKDAKNKPGIYEDKFQNDINAVRTILPQYDEEMEDGMTLDESGGINEEGRKRLEELRKKLQGVEQKAHKSLSGSASVASDFYTQEEMLQFNKPKLKKKKKLRKKEVLDLDAMEAEAKAEGLGDADLGSRSSSAKQAQKLEKEKAAEEARKSAYMNAYTKAVDASQKLRLGSVTDTGGEEAVVFGAEEDDELERSLQRARQAALKKQSENGGSSTGPQAVASALQQASEMEIEMGHADDAGERDKTSVVFTETEEFCRNIQLDEILLRRPGAKDVFAEDDEPVEEEKPHGLDGGWMEVNEDNKDHKMEEKQAEEDPSGEEAVAEVAVGKGLSGALQLLKERGTLKETVEWGGRNMDKKKSKLVGIVDQEEKFKNREILLERVDEFGRVMTPKEAFRKLSHKFHGKGPGKMKQEKRMKQYEEEMKLKQMLAGDTPLLSMEKMRDAQAKLHTPYLVISGHIQPGQTSDPGSGFATMDKESIGSLTPMLGDQKVEYFLGIKRKPEGGSMRPPLPKKPKT